MYKNRGRRRSLAPKSLYYTTFLKFCQGFFCTKIKKFFPKIYASCIDQFWLFAQKFLYFFVFFVQKGENIFSFLHKDLMYFLKKMYKMHKFLLFYVIYTKKLRFLLIFFTWLLKRNVLLYRCNQKGGSNKKRFLKKLKNC